MKRFTTFFTLVVLIIFSFQLLLGQNYKSAQKQNKNNLTNSESILIKVDSYGNPIVNETDGLPDWAQSDIDALKVEIENYLQKKNEKLSSDILYELDYVLGNFIGQAFVRNINISGIVDLYNSEIVTKEVAGSVLDFLHYYENVKYDYLGEGYQPTVYPKEIEDFVMQAGGQLQEILSIEPTNVDYTPSGAYTKITTNTGLVNLTGYTTVWNGGVSVCDDCYDDIPIGFNFYFYEGDDDDANTQVRVSSNGYISFFQQGGGALDGTDYTNDAITSTVDPDGFAAPWWDDMIVDAQGSTDFVAYKTEGSVGSRVFTVQFYSLTRRTGDTDDYHTFQVKLYEANDEIRFNFGSWNSDVEDNGTVGMEDYSGTDGDCGPNCTNLNDAKPPNNYQFVPYAGTAGLWKGIHSSDWHLAANWDNLEIPTSSTDVEIPDGTPYSPEITSNAYCHDINIHGHLTLDGSSARLYVDDDIFWESGSSATVTSVTARIYVEDDWQFKNGADVQLGGYVYFQGTNSSTITVLDPDCSFYHMRNQKDNTTLSFSSTSTEPLRINGILYLDGTSTFQSYEGVEPIIHNGRISNTGGSLHLNNGTWEFTSGGTSTFTTGDYFNNLKVSAGAVVFGDDVEVTGDVTISGGSFNTGGITLTVGGDWVNTVGVGAFIQGTARVIFNGSSNQYCNYDEDFNILEVDKSAGEFRVNSATAEVYCNSYDWSDGAINILEGTFSAYDLNDNGIEGEWYLDDGGIINLTNNVGTVDLLGDIHIYGGTMNVYGGDHDSYWPGDANASLEMTGGNFIFHDEGIYIRSTGTFTDNISGDPHIGTYDNLRIDRADFTPTAGMFVMNGASNNYIRIDNGSISYLNITKESPAYTVSANTDLNIENNIDINDGTFDLNGHSVSCEIMGIFDGVLKMTNSADFIELKEIVWHSGSSANITNGNIEVENSWTFYNFANVQLGQGSTVTFKSNVGNSYFSSYSADAEFGNVVIDSDAKIWGTSTQPVRVAGDFTVNAGYEFDVQGEDLIVDGTLDIEDGALMTLFAASNDGSLVVNDGCILEGDLDVGIGTATFNDGLFSASTSQLSIDDGICAVYPSSQTLIQGGFDLSNDGLFEIHNTLSFSNTAILNITGGKIRIQLDLHLYVDFNPSGGTVEFFGSTNDSQIGFHGNNGAFYDLDIDKTFSSLVVLLNDISIQNNITINSGCLSSGFSTSYDIDVGGDWTNNVGTSGFTEGTGTVFFYGSGTSEITTNETFYNLVINKTNTAYNAIEIPADKELIVLNDLDISDGCLEMNANSILNVNQNIHIFSGAGINAVSDNNLNIYVGGIWDNDNTSYSTTYGFNPGTSSTVTFDGSATSYLYTDCSHEDFYHIVVDKGVGSHLGLHDNLHISGDYLGSSGGIVNTSANLSHEFWGDITVESNGFVNLGSGTFTNNTLKGTSEQVLSSPDGSNLYLGNLVIDKDYPASIVRVINDGFFLNNLDVNEGTMNLYGDTHLIFEDIIVNNGGKLDLGAGGTIFTDGAIMVFSGGYFEAVGISGNEALITRQDELGFSLNVSSGGTIAAQHTNFEFLTNNGININNGATVDPAYTFNNCTFSGSWEGITTLLSINNSQNLTIDGAEFDDFGVATINVSKTQNQGSVLFTNATGLFAGPTFENDPNDRIDWDGFVAGTWTGAVNDDWNNPSNWQYSMKPTDSDDATIPSGTPNNPKVYNAPAFCKNLNIAAGASLHIDDETLTVDGDLEIYGELQMDNAAGVLNLENNVTWQPGSTDQITDGTINIKEKWIFMDGANAQLGTSNTVVFVPGGSYHQIECHEANAEFGSVIINVSTTIHGGSTQHVTISGNCTVNAPYEFDVQGESLYVNGTLDINDGALMTLYAGSNEGMLTNFSYFLLEGELDVGIGNAYINSNFDVGSTGVLNITDGWVVQQNSTAYTDIDGEINFTGNGTIIFNSPFRINSGSDVTVTNGEISIDGAFIVNGINTFQPSGGTIKMIGSSVSLNCNKNDGNFFHNLFVNSSVGETLTLDSDIKVRNDITIYSGYLNCNNSPSYDIDVGGNWTNNIAYGDFLEENGTVTFYGGNPSDITTDETFYNLVIDKTYSVNDGVDIIANNTVNVLNDLTITDGCMEMNDNSTLNIDNDINIALNAGLNAQNDSNLNIFVVGDWNNLNTAYDNNWGFSPGTSSTVTFDGSSVSELLSYNTHEVFHNLTINKPSGSLTLLDDIEVNGELTVDNGDLKLAASGQSQSHILTGNVTVNGGSVSGVANSSSTVTLEGSSDQVLTSYDMFGLDFYELVINKNSSKDNGQKAQTANITGAGFEAYRLTIDEGTLNFDGSEAWIESHTYINDGGKLTVGPGATFKPGFFSNITGNVIVNSGGEFEAVGISGNEATVDVGNAFSIESGGTIGAEYAVFRDMTGDGINIKTGATINASYPFVNCTFSGDEANATLLTINNNQTLTIDGASFINNGSASYNVAKTQDQGDITFTNATGLFAGPTFENDPNDRIDWDGFVAGTWTGLVSNDWNDPANWQNSLKPGAANDVTIPSGTPNDPLISSDDQECDRLTLAAGATLTVTGKTLTVNGTLDIEDAALIKLYEGTTGGTLVNNSNLELNGHLNVGPGIATINASFDIEPTGVLDISSGQFNQTTYVPALAWIFVQGEFNMTGDGIFSTESGLWLDGNSNVNIFDGLIQISKNIDMTGTNTFQPTGGTVLFTGDSPSVISCPQVDGNFFYNLEIGKVSGIIGKMSNSIEVKNDISINSGVFSCSYGTTSYDMAIGGNWINHVGNAGFDESTGTITFDGTGNKTITSANTYEQFYKMEIDKTGGEVTLLKGVQIQSGELLAVHAGDLNLNGNTLTTNGNIEINNGGSLLMDTGSELAIDDGRSLTVNNGGTFAAIGVSGDEALVTNISGNYGFDVESGATIEAYYAIFEYMAATGVNVKSGAIIDGTNDFDNCIFRNGVSGGTLLSINNNQTLSIDGVQFPSNTWSGTYNVAKSEDQGQVTFTNTTGLFAGPTYENDPYDRIDWSDFVTGLWTGAVSNDWNDPANWQNSLKPGVANDVTIPSGTPNDPFISSDDQECDGLTIEAGTTLTVTGKTLTVNGTLDIEDGAVMTLYDGATGGYLINNSYFDLSGELDVGIGSATINHNFIVRSTGVLNITNGSFIQPSGSLSNYIHGEFNLTGDGVFHPHKYIYFESGSDINVTAGLIQTERDIWFLGSNTFQPTGGTIEIVGSEPNGTILCDKASGNYLYNLIINKTVATSIELIEDTEIRGNLDIDSGIFGIDLFNDLDIDGNWTNNVGNTGTNIGFGTVTFTGPGNQTLTTVDTYENFPRFGINKSGGELTLFSDVNVSSDDTLLINAGDMNLNGQGLSHAGDIEINNGGRLLMDAGSELAIAEGKSLTINNGGTLSSTGVSGDESLITHIFGNYNLNVESGGTIEAYYSIFEYMSANGINVKSGAIIDGTDDFDNCIFRNGVSGGTLLSINNNQTLSIDGVQFPANTWGGTYNVAKTLDQGQITFTNYSGSFSGSGFENDSFNRIDWDAPGFDLDVTVFLEGPFNETTMNTGLTSLTDFPLSQPYSGSPWNYGGTENATSIPANVVDWILVELRDAPNAASAITSTMIAQQAAFLLNDGSVVGLDGSSILSFNNSIVQQLFIVVWHRNHVGLMSANGASETGGIYTYDFTTPTDQAYGINAQKNLGGGNYGMYAGDGDANGTVGNSDKTLWQQNVGTSSYRASDFNMDKQSDNQDKNDIWLKNNGKSQQFPE